MYKHPAKILFILVLLGTLAGCNAVKRVPDGEFLLSKNTIVVNGEENTTPRVNDIPYQQENNKLLGLPLRLYIYNWARPNIDSIMHSKLIENDSKRRFWTAVLSRKQLDKYIQFREDFNQALKNTGEAPTIVSENLTQRSADRLNEFYGSNGWFNAKTTYEISRDSSSKRASVAYDVNTGKPYILDSLNTFIRSPQVDSIYKRFENQSLIKQGKQYKRLDINAEVTRLTNLFRNRGIFYFDREYINFIGDTVNTDYKVNLELYIRNRELATQDSVYEEFLKVHRISKVRVYTDYTYAQRNDIPLDSAYQKGYELFAFNKINYKPRLLTDAIFIDPGDIYSDKARNQSLIRLSQLRTFRYPDLRYTVDPESEDGTDLIANFYLTPLAKYTLRANFDVSTSNIQKVGIAGSGSLLIRNVFGGLETLQLSARGSIGASASEANDEPSFFDITELGADISLTMPRIFFPINTTRFISPESSPSTSFNIGFGVQQNIGLDKQNITGGINYKWLPNPNLNLRYDLFDIQYVRNLNTDNYFNIYRNSYGNLNEIAANNLPSNSPLFDPNSDSPSLIITEGTTAFINGVENGSIPVSNDEFEEVSSIEERRERLTEDNLILASSFTFQRNTRAGIFDDEFTSVRAKLELSGNVLSAISNIADLEENENGSHRVLGVTFSQYVKTELDFIKHWDLGNDNILAVRAFGGIAIPYGNSKSIPFIRSFFGGGSNDNRAWQAYRLGPGRTDSPNDFNEANMKLAFNVEQRFEIIGDFKGAIFADMGNIWNVLDNVEDPNARFNGLSSLKDIAIGSGFGLRYDFSFFVFRFDIGFKTYNPAREVGNRWFKEYNFTNAVYNIGINYPF